MAYVTVAFWLIVVAPPLPLFLPSLSALPLLLLSADAITTVTASKATAPIPSATAAAAAAAGTYFVAITASSLISLPITNVSTAQTLPLFPLPPNHCLCLQCLCQHRFRHGSHHYRKPPTCRSVGASEGSSRDHGRVSREQKVCFRQHFSISD